MSDKMKIMNSGTWQCPSYVPFSMLCEHQADTNHSQSLSRLNERGGVIASECLALIMQVGCRELRNISEQFASAVIAREILSQHEIGLLKTDNEALKAEIEKLKYENSRLASLLPGG